MGKDIRIPQLTFTLLCDDIRQEMGGKMSFMGVFESIYAEQFPAIHLRLVILNEWSGGTGDHETLIRLSTPDRKTSMAETRSTLSLGGELHRCRHISVFLNLEFKTEGTYWVDILLDGRVVSTVPVPVVHLHRKNFH